MSSSVPPPGSPPPGSPPPGSPPPGTPYPAPADRGTRASADRPPLRRRREDKLLAGVLSGVADHLGLDVVIARILFVVLTLMTQGAFILAYILGWIFIPEETEDEAATRRPPHRDELRGRDPLFWVGIGTLIVAVLWLLDGPFHVPGPFRFGADRSVLVPLVLIAFGIALWRATDRPSSAPDPSQYRRMSPPEPAMSNTDPSTSDTVRIDAPASAPHDTRVIDPPAWGAAPPPGTPPTAHGGGDDWSPPPVPTSRGVLTRITLGIAALTVGILWLLDVAELTDLGPGRIISAALLVIGAGLLVGTVVGRGRGLIGAGLLLLPVVLLLQVVQPLPVDVFSAQGQAFGSNFETPDDEAALQDSYQVGAGELWLDLRDIDFTEDRDVAVQVGFGEVRVLVPDDVSVEVVGRIGGGEMILLGRRSDGVGLERTVLGEVAGSDTLLTIEVNVGFGQATVQRASTIADREELRFPNNELESR